MSSVCSVRIFSQRWWLNDDELMSTSFSAVLSYSLFWWACAGFTVCWTYLYYIRMYFMFWGSCPELLQAFSLQSSNRVKVPAEMISMELWSLHAVNNQLIDEQKSCCFREYNIISDIWTHQHVIQSLFLSSTWTSPEAEHRKACFCSCLSVKVV